MARRKLTAKLVENLRAPVAGRIEMHDAVIPALVLRITDNGAKSYTVRTRISGRQVRKLLGSTATMTLKEARELAGDVLKAAARGIDLLEQQKRDACAAADAALAAERLEWTKIRREFVEEHAKPNTRRWKETEQTLKRCFDPAWKGRLLPNIDRDDVLEVILKIKKDSGVYAANRALAAVRKLFNWAALQPKMLKHTPIVRGMAQKGERPRERVLSDAELRAIWQAADKLATPFRQYIQLLMLTGQRVGEIKRLEKSEINDPDALIEFSGARYKNGRPHVVPLMPLAAEIVGTLPEFEGCPYVVTVRGKAPIDCDSHVRELLDEEISKTGGTPIENWRLHDIRRTVRTNLSKLGINSDIGERVMGHVISGVRGVYDRYDFLAEKRHALALWERYLCRITGRTPVGNVVDFRLPGRSLGEPPAGEAVEFDLDKSTGSKGVAPLVG